VVEKGEIQSFTRGIIFFWEANVERINLIGRGYLLVFGLIFLCTSCGGRSTPSPTQTQNLLSPSAEESAISPATPAEPTIAPPTEMIFFEEPTEAAGTPFTLSSNAFIQEAAIPTRYSCDGENISPPLEWGDPPQGTESFALILDDPDAPGGTWVHWILYNIPAEVRALPEAIPPEEELPDGSRHGENSFGRLDYGGPCPPSGTHRYFFKLYALDVTLDLEPGVDKKTLLQAMEGHVLAEAELMGTYPR
jgi:Raf kinase inhibitor-like YbhB/YbcL family protein